MLDGFHRGLVRAICSNRLALGLLVLLLMLPNIVWVAMPGSWVMWLPALLLNALFIALVLAVARSRLWLGVLVLVPFAMMAPLEAYYVYRYGSPTTYQTLSVIRVADWSQWLSYLGPLWMLALILPLAGGLFAVIVAWRLRSARVQWRGRVAPGLLAVVVGTTLVVLVSGFATSAGSVHARFKSAVAPLSVLEGAGQHSFTAGLPIRLWQYRTQWAEMQENVRRLADYRFGARRNSGSVGRRQIHVLAIGESSRRSNWQIMGYHRATNPELSVRQRVVPITNMVTPWTATIASVVAMITRRPIESSDFDWPEPSFMTALNETGYTTWWVSNHYPLGRYNSPISAYAYQATHVLWVNKSPDWATHNAYDDVMLPALQRAIQESEGDVFVVLHLMGSHMDYDYRYPAEFTHFRPTQSDKKDASLPTHEKILNSYDNSIVYSDYILSRLIDMLEAEDAITSLMFVSDHGEVLPTATCHNQGHGLGSRQTFEVPAFFWYSTAFGAQYPEKVSAMKKNSTQPTLTASVFQSMLDVTGVVIPDQDASWSLFSPDWRFRTRNVTNFWRVNFDEVEFSGACEIAIPDVGVKE